MLQAACDTGRLDMEIIENGLTENVRGDGRRDEVMFCGMQHLLQLLVIVIFSDFSPRKGTK